MYCIPKAADVGYMNATTALVDWQMGRPVVDYASCQLRSLMWHGGWSDLQVLVSCLMVYWHTASGMQLVWTAS